MLNEVTATVPLEVAEKDTELYHWARAQDLGRDQIYLKAWKPKTHLQRLKPGLQFDEDMCKHPTRTLFHPTCTVNPQPSKLLGGPCGV